MAARRHGAVVRQDGIALGGGEDLVSPGLSIDPGRVLLSNNIECPIEGGYRSSGAYVRYDGRTSPDSVTYCTLPFTAGTTVGASNARDRRLSMASIGLPWLIHLPLANSGIDASDRRMLIGIPARSAVSEMPLVHGMTVTGQASGATGVVLLTKRLPFTAGERKPLIAEVVTGQTSGVTGIVVYVETTGGAWEDGTMEGYLYLRAVSGTFFAAEPVSSPLGGRVTAAAASGDYTTDSGAWALGTATGTLVLACVSGSFTTGESLDIAAVLTATAGTIGHGDAATDPQHYAAVRQAIEYQRSQIGVVPGSGPLRGVWAYNGSVYAFRDNSGGTACAMYRASATGWQLVTFSEKLSFDAGTAAIAVGDTITGATSGATAVVAEVVISSGSWGSAAAGRLFIGGRTGTFADNELLRVGGANKATADGTQSAVTLLPGGRFEFENHNFFAQSDRRRMYWVDGVNRAHQFDGVTAVPIVTPEAVDAPKHLRGHKKYLFLSFAGGTVHHSPIGNPLGTWTALTGAQAIGTSDEVTGMVVLPGDVMGIFDRNRTYILYGSSSADWDLQNHSSVAGAREWSVQMIGTARYMDDRGLTSLDVTDTFGDFQAATWSQQIEPLIRSKLDSGVTVTASVAARTKNQYRIFFSDGSALYATWNGGKLAGITRLDLGKVVRCVSSVELADGTEALFFGSDDGYVYRLDTGTSQDGVPIESYFRLPYYHYKSPSRYKGFVRVALEADAGIDTEILFQPDFGYGDVKIPEADSISLPSTGGGGQWDVANWNEFQWSASPTAQLEGNPSGVSTNMGLFIYNRRIYSSAWTIHGILVDYLLMARKR